MQKPDSWALFDHPPAESYRNGRVALLADAAHASTPHQGAGAGMALDDAYVLASLFGEVHRMEGIEEAFRVYGGVRRKISQRLVSTSRDAGDLYEFRKGGVGDDVERVRDLDESYRWVWRVGLERDL